MYILVGSVTTATRLKKAAEKIIGFPAYVVHTPSALNQGGCPIPCVLMTEHLMKQKDSRR